MASNRSRKRVCGVTLTPSDTNPSLIKWSTVHNFGAAATAARGLCVWPETISTTSFRVGFDPVNNLAKPYGTVTLNGTDYLQLYTNKDANNLTEIQQWSSTSAGLGHIRLEVEIDGTTQYYYFHEDDFYANTNKQSDLGLALKAWDDAYADDWHNVADLYHLDTYNDLQTILDIKPSGKIDERTGLPLIDDDTLPDWMLTKHKQDGKVMDKDEKVLSTYKKGDIARDPNNKPWLSNKIMFSLIMGSIKELNQKIEGLK